MPSPAENAATVREAHRDVAASLIAVKGHLDTPYPDDPRWTPWTRFVERSLKRLDESKQEIAALLAQAEAADDQAHWRQLMRTELASVEAERDAAVREADSQLAQKLAAQMTLKAVCDALDLPMVSLGNGWTEATPKIVARIEIIVDEANRGFRERDAAEQRAADMETALGPLLAAYEKHLQTGLYEPLGMAAQDFLVALSDREEQK